MSGLRTRPTEKLPTVIEKKPTMVRGNHLHSWLGVALASVTIVAGGFGYRLMASAIDSRLSQPVRLERPLRSLPLALGAWQGEDVELSEATLRIAQNDDYVNREYHHTETGEAVGLYIAYTARPRTMLRHRPTVCYPSAGWSHLQTQETTLPIAGGKSLPVLIHRFLKPGMTEARTVVLNYYVLNGRLTIDEDRFWGISWRDPNLRRDASRYVAQIQITAGGFMDADGAERSVRRFAVDAAEVLLALLPGTDG